MNKFWNLLGWFFYRFVNRMKCGNLDTIKKCLTISPLDSYHKYDNSLEPIQSFLKAHTFWHGDITSKQLFCLKSFLATQNMQVLELYIWLDGDIWYKKAIENSAVQELVHLFNGKIHLRKWNLADEIKGTPFEKIKWYFKWKRPLPFVADDFRLITLYNHGGLYFDMDIMFVKNFMPLLLRDEFIYAWETQPFGNNALIYLRKGSYLCLQIAKKMVQRKSSQPWIVFRYTNKFMSNMMVYPSSMFDPLWTGYKESMPIKDFSDFFNEFKENRDMAKVCSFKNFFPGIYAYHWHNCWNHEEFDKSYFGVFNNEFNEILGIK